MKGIHFIHYLSSWASQVAQRLKKNPPAKQEIRIQSLGQEDPPREGNGNPLQYSCLGNPMDRGAWRATVYGVAKSWMQLSGFDFQPTYLLMSWVFY